MQRKTDWGFDCCNPIPIADFTHRPSPVYLRHIGPDCYPIEEPLSLTELQKRIVRKFATQAKRG